MISISDKAKIYVVCPPRYASGGPELLHQLVNKLTILGFDAFMYYYPTHNDPVHVNFLKYNTKFVNEIEDKKENVLILPEALIIIDFPFLKIRKCVWWLSIDNFFKHTTEIRWKVFNRTGLKIIYSVIKEIFFNKKIKGKYEFHLAQSHYALTFLKNRGVKSAYLSDYLSDAFFNNKGEVNIFIKKNQVLYNPKKGYEFTEKLMKFGGDKIKWVPIINLAPEQVADLLKESKIYVDFGKHPGKDRFPREAAMMRCCVITSRNGSAAYYEDVPISGNYKFDELSSNIPKVIDLINSIFENFESHSKDFNNYIEKIEREEEVFLDGVKSIFVKI